VSEDALPPGEAAITAPEALPPFSPEGFAVRARNRLTLDVPADTFRPDVIPAAGDHLLAPSLTPHEGTPHRPAAVLVGVVAHPGEATLLLTRRASHLRDHSGQVAFPGGKIDSADASPLDAALREASEEIGLQRERVTPLGYLPPYLTSTGFRILPLVAVVEPGFDLTINRDEVDIAFAVPLAFLMTEANHQRHAREWKGSVRHYYAMPYGEHYVWGVTAGILRTLYERLYAP
jgi:8-oxo-dGTP pyrophosphatase MutT (NUDIX family)